MKSPINAGIVGVRTESRRPDSSRKPLHYERLICRSFSVFSGRSGARRCSQVPSDLGSSGHISGHENRDAEEAHLAVDTPAATCSDPQPVRSAQAPRRRANETGCQLMSFVPEESASGRLLLDVASGVEPGSHPSVARETPRSGVDGPVERSYGPRPGPHRHSSKPWLSSSSRSCSRCSRSMRRSSSTKLDGWRSDPARLSHPRLQHSDEAARKRGEAGPRLSRMRHTDLRRNTDVRGHAWV
jgi:hypothetical protein